jgi:hypothetical protein
MRQARLPRRPRPFRPTGSLFAKISKPAPKKPEPKRQQLQPAAGQGVA